MDTSSAQWYIVMSLFFGGMYTAAGMPVSLTVMAFYASVQLAAFPLYWWAVQASYGLLVAVVMIVRSARGRG